MAQQDEEAVNVGPLERGISLALGAAAGSAALRRRGAAGLMLGVVAGFLVYRGATGRSRLYRALGVSAYGPGRTVEAFSQVTVQLPPRKVYAFLRDLSNVPRFSRLVERVDPLGPLEWRCAARLPGKGLVTWKMRKTVDEADRRLAWSSAPDSRLPCALDVRLVGQGDETRVFVDAWFDPPAPSLLGAALRRAERSRPLRRAGMTPSRLLEFELRRLRQLLEAGETATTWGQSSGRLKEVGRQRARLGLDENDRLPSVPERDEMRSRASGPTARRAVRA